MTQTRIDQRPRIVVSFKDSTGRHTFLNADPFITRRIHSHRDFMGMETIKRFVLWRHTARPREDLPLHRSTTSTARGCVD